MEEYLKDRSKSKAIAVYTFKSISNQGEDRLSIDKFKLGLKETFKHFDIVIEEGQVDEIINQVDRFQKGYLQIQDFCEAFDKVFSVYLKMKNL